MKNRAGKLPEKSDLIDVKKTIKSYYENVPDAENPAEKVAFGTSGHRGNSVQKSFNEAHIVAITTSLLEFRKSRNLNGPIFVGFDTHILSLPAFRTICQILTAAKIEFFIDNHISENLLNLAESGKAPKNSAIFTPTPAISRAIISYNRKIDAENFAKVARGEKANLAKLSDGIVITPSHNPPTDGGFKYNPEHGGPADSDATKIIENRANEILANENWRKISRADFSTALKFAKKYDFRAEYIKDLQNVVDLTAISESGIRICADSLGGAAVDYWPEIARNYNLNLTEIREKVDPRFPFLTLDADEKIRMDCSSKFAMNGLVNFANNERHSERSEESLANSGDSSELKIPQNDKNYFDIFTGNDCDSDRHGIVSRKDENDEFSLMNPNYFLAVCIWFLWQNRPKWFENRAKNLSENNEISRKNSDKSDKNSAPKIGKTLVSSRMIDFVARDLGADLVETPVGFKWFVAGFLSGEFGFAGEESAGATFLDFSGEVWTTDKDGIILDLLAAEIFAKTGKSPAKIFAEFTQKFGESFYERIDAPATIEQKNRLKNLSAKDVKSKILANEKIEKIETSANSAPIGGVKISTKNAWFAARPSGTENIYKIYAESFVSRAHLKEVQKAAQDLVNRAIR